MRATFVYLSSSQQNYTQGQVLQTVPMHRMRAIKGERGDQCEVPAVGPWANVFYSTNSESLSHLNTPEGRWPTSESSSFLEPPENVYVTPSTLARLEWSPLKCGTGSQCAK